MSADDPRPLPLREERLRDLEQRDPDVLVVGGGITGVGIALDLALRGVRTLVVEKEDWASATSSASSRLIHGGLRYLEQYEFGLVRDSCLERGLLLRNAAGYVWPERFTFPVHRGDGVGLAKLAAGLALYTLVSVPRVLGVPHLNSKDTVRARIPGIRDDGLRGAGDYLDGATDDARLTLAIVASAIEAGALALSRTEALRIEKNAEGARTTLVDRLTEREFSVSSRAVVLAAGPQVDLLRERANLGGQYVAPTRGSHLVLPRKRLPTDGAVIFPSAVDGRIMFLIPWPHYTIVGTTDLDAVPGEPARATWDEVDYLLRSANGLVPAAQLTSDDVVSTWAGLRPLLAADESDPSSRSREERIEREGPLYTIAGGKLTGYRSMAEKLCDQLTSDLAIGARGSSSPTREHRLRGALHQALARPRWSDFGNTSGNFEAIEPAWSKRYAAWSSHVQEFCSRAPEGRRPLDEETLLGEVDWSVRFEDCLTAEDFFFRRTDLGFGPRSRAEDSAQVVLERLSRALGWDEATREREGARLSSALDRTHRWRTESPRNP